MKIRSFIFVLILFFASCEGKQGTVPYTKVNFTVSVYANNLIHVGGHEYFSGGISGVVVYRLDMSNFCVYDRACPYDWASNGYVIYDQATMQLNCAVCGSSFNILNGYPMNNSKANIFLRAYQARLVNDITLHIYN